MNFQELLDKISKAKETSQSIPGDDPNTIHMRLGNIRRAKENLEILFMEYRKHVIEKAVFIISTGDKSADFVKKSEKDFGCFSLDSNELFETVAASIDDSIWKGKAASNTLINVMGAVFEEIALKIGVTSYNALMMDLKHKRNLSSKEDLVSFIRTIFLEKVGGEIVGLYSADKIARKAIDEGFNGKTVPILLTVSDESYVADLHSQLRRMFPNTFVVVSGEASEKTKNISIDTLEKVSKASVESTLLKIKSNLN